MRVKVVSEGWLGSVELLGPGGFDADDNITLDLTIDSALSFACFAGLERRLGGLNDLVGRGRLERCGLRCFGPDLTWRRITGWVLRRCTPRIWRKVRLRGARFRDADGPRGSVGAVGAASSLACDAGCF